MSRELIQTTLGGHDGPLAVNVSQLMDARLGMPIVNGLAFDEIARTFDTPVNVTRPTTDDGYDWFWAFEFAVDTGTVVVAFPWAQDWDRKDDDQADRSVAVYASGPVAQEQAQHIVDTLAQRMSGFR